MNAYISYWLVISNLLHSSLKSEGNKTFDVFINSPSSGNKTTPNNMIISWGRHTSSVTFSWDWHLHNTDVLMGLFFLIWICISTNSRVSGEMRHLWTDSASYHGWLINSEIQSLLRTYNDAFWLPSCINKHGSFSSAKSFNVSQFPQTGWAMYQWLMDSSPATFVINIV